MVERRLFIEIFILLLVLSGQLGIKFGAPSTPGTSSAHPNEIYAERIINIHQPVYQPGYGNFQTVKPMFMTPPPPVIMENKILQPSPVYNAKEIRISKKAKVISYPMHKPNQFNYYQFPRTYNPYFGKEAPVNAYHPFNMLYGPLPYTPVGGYGLPFGPSGEQATISGELQEHRNYVPMDLIPSNVKMENQNTEEVDLSLRHYANRALLNAGRKKGPTTTITREEKMPVGSFDGLGMGFNTFDGVGYDLFSAQMGPFGPSSPYAMSSERQLAQMPLIGPMVMPPYQMI
jgi:hypothetical protein